MNNELDMISQELQRLFNKGMKSGAYDLNDSNVFIQIVTRLAAIKIESNRAEQMHKESQSDEQSIKKGPKTKHVKGTKENTKAVS